MLSGRGIISIFFGVFTSLIGTVFQFILMYLLIRSYGAQFNGFVKISVALLLFLGGVEGGLGALTVIFLMKPLIQKDWSRANEILSTAKYQYKIGGFIDLVLLILISIVYSSYAYFAESSFIIIWNGKNTTIYPFWKMLLIILTIGSKNLFTLFCSACYENLMQANQKNYVRRLISIICDLIVYSIIFYLITLNVDPVYIFLVFLGYSVLKAILVILYVKRNYPWVVIVKQKNNLQLVKSSKIVSLKNIGDSLLLNTTIIIIAILLGLKVSSTLSLYMTIAIGFRIIMMILINSFKEFFASWTAKNGRINWSKYVKYETYAYIIGAFLFVNQFILSPYFVNALYATQIIPEFDLWTKNEKQLFDIIFCTPTFSLLVSIESVFLIIAEPCNVLVYAKANYKQTAKTFFLFGIISLILSFFFAIIFLYAGGNPLSSLYSVLIISCIISFFRFVYLWWYTWLNLTYNSNFKGIFQNWMILLIPIICSILFNYLYIKNVWNIKNIFDDNLNVIWGWKILLSILFCTIASSMLFIFINSLLWAPKSVIEIFLCLPIIYQICNRYKTKISEKFHKIFEDDLVISLKESKNPYQQQWKREELVNKKIDKATNNSTNYINLEIYKLKG